MPFQAAQRPLESEGGRSKCSELEDDTDAAAAAAAGAVAALAWPLEALLADAQTWRDLHQQQEPGERCARAPSRAPFAAHAS